MKVVTIGGGPAGLYFALLMKKANPTHAITVLERNAPDDTFGWGVVFSDQTMENFRAADPESYQEIIDNFAHWDDIDVHFKGTTVTSGGHGFSGIARKTLLDILRRRAEGLGVDMRFRCDVKDDAQLGSLGLGDADLVVAADGVNSMIRRKYAEHFQPELDLRRAKYIWLGTTKLFDAFTFAFVENACGVYQAHAYRFNTTHSAFIVECDDASWRAAGFDTLDAGAAIVRCEEMFAPWLDGHPLMSNAAHIRGAPWLSFLIVRTAKWFHENIVLIGDAAHTAHFSIGSGTKLAMEDAIVLARELGVGSRELGDRLRDVPSRPITEPAGAQLPTPDSSLSAALERYQAIRQTEALRLQNAARNSMEWFENVKRYVNLEPTQFAYSLLTRSQRVSHENLRLRDRRYLVGVERWFAARANGRVSGEPKGAPMEGPGGAVTSAAAPAPPPPPMFTPFTLRGLTIPNRIVVSPMDMYCADDGVPNDFHLVHLGARALGGAGLVMTEMTCVSPEARITYGCTGMYHPDHVEAWRRITRFVKQWSRARICLQLGHSGRKGSTKLMLEGTDIPLDEGNWEVIGPSGLPHRPTMQVPRAMTRADMDKVRDDFARATSMAVDAGFEMVELHCAHGYLLSSFITPIANRRTDEYGGSLANRLRFPLEVFRAMREVWPEERPMSVRISATDWVNGGVTGEESVAIAQAFHGAGADIIHVSTGQTSPDARPVYGRMWQTPFSDRIRNEAGIPTIAVGNITDPDQVNSIIAAGRADLCALARPHLTDPNWTLHAAAQLGFSDQYWPPQYNSGRQQLERTVAREKELRGVGS